VTKGEAFMEKRKTEMSKIRKKSKTLQMKLFLYINEPDHTFIDTLVADPKKGVWKLKSFSICAEIRQR
jgi:hypothetical protein